MFNPFRRTQTAHSIELLNNPPNTHSSIQSVAPEFFKKIKWQIAETAATPNILWIARVPKGLRLRRAKAANGPTQVRTVRGGPASPPPSAKSREDQKNRDGVEHQGPDLFLTARTNVQADGI